MRLLGVLSLTLLAGVISANAESRDTRGVLTDILKWTKDQVVEVPQEIASQVIDSVCGSMVANIIRPTYRIEPNDVECYLTKHGRNVSFPLTSPNAILNDLESNSPLTIFVSGFDSEFSRDGLRALHEAYQCRGEQFLTVSVAEHIHDLRSWALLDAESLGKVLGEAVFSMTSKVPAENIHLIGHSVGAHIAGAAGRRYFQLSGKLLPRISGLDPALPCYKETTKHKVLRRGQAEFVDIIHTNVGFFGISYSVGDVDFWTNGKGTLEPGCSEVVCSHSRAMQYFAETVYPGNENAFLAHKCKESDSSYGQSPMGLLTPSNLKGDYCLETREAVPYGLNRTSSQPVRCSEVVNDYNPYNRY